MNYLSFDFQRNSVDSMIDSVTLGGYPTWLSWCGSFLSSSFDSTFCHDYSTLAASFNQLLLPAIIVAFTIRSATATILHFAHNFTVQGPQ